MFQLLIMGMFAATGAITDKKSRVRGAAMGAVVYIGAQAFLEAMRRQRVATMGPVPTTARSGNLRYPG